MSVEKETFFVALDIGTSKIVTMIGKLNDEGTIEVVGFGQSESFGLKRGVVVNIDATVESIKKSLEEAELMAGYKIEKVWTGIAGSHIKSFNSTGMVAVREKEV
jgi:cell division protein FtsA